MLLHLDMPSGIAGDMLLAALLDAGGDLERLRADLRLLGLGDIGITATRVLVGGLAALRVEVAAPQDANWTQPRLALDLRGAQQTARPAASAVAGTTVAGAPEHATGHADHRPYRDIRGLLERASALPPRVVARAQAVFRLLAEAEAEVHGSDPESVEFHEVGAIDAIADVVGCCLLLEQLGIERIVASPLLPGHGTVWCAHGRMPVPVPAVARMLLRTLPRSGVRPPWRSLAFESGELTTPTGAALVCALADTFLDANAEPAALRVMSSGLGAGHKTIPRLVNVTRVLVCEELDGAAGTDDVTELTCQLDDATGEHLAQAMERLLAAGALDVALVPALLKKGRPGHVLTVLARPAEAGALADLVLTLTPSIGLRMQRCQRRVLPRRMVTVTWRGQAIPCKVVDLPGGGTRAKPEDDAVRAASLASGLAPAEVSRQVLAELDRLG